MKRWIVVSVAVLASVLAVSGMAGCGAKLPTTTEDVQGDPHDQKLQTYTEVIENGDAQTPVQ
jgi:hypothetical protein